MSPVYVLVRRSLVVEGLDGDTSFVELPLPGQKSMGEDISRGETLTVEAPSLGDPTLLALSPGQEVMVVEGADGLHKINAPKERAMEHTLAPVRYAHPELLHACTVRSVVTGSMPVRRSEITSDWLEPLAAHSLVLPRSDRWNQALITALLGNWCAPLMTDGFLPATALSALKAEARTLHRQLVPLWRRRTKHGRVLSLDADLGGLSLYDLVAADVDHLSHTSGGVFEDERLNAVLRGLHRTERQVVFAYAAGEGTTWAKAAAAVGTADPDALGERVRRKAKRLAAEHCRRTAQTTRPGSFGGPISRSADS
ncbi:hypothetical protein [Streptomyces aureus]